MERKLILGILLTMLLSGTLSLAFNIQQAEAQGTVYIRADGSIDPPTASISSANNITYTFTGNISVPIVVQKDNIAIDGNEYVLQGAEDDLRGFSLSGRNVTIKRTHITGFYWSIYLLGSSGNTITNNTLTGSYNGVFLGDSSDNIITNNVITGIKYSGIYIDRSNNNTIGKNTIAGNGDGIHFARPSNDNAMIDNVVTNNGDGMVIYGSNGNVVRNNSITNNRRIGLSLDSSGSNELRNNSLKGNAYNFDVSGGALRDFINDVDVSNTVDGKPVYYWVNQQNKQVPSDAGYVAVINSTNITVKGLNPAQNGQGVLFVHANNSIIENINLRARGYIGIELSSSYHNDIINNTVTNIVEGSIGIQLIESGDNRIHHNNFVNNTNQAHPYQSFNNTWDDGYPSGGNYWSDYAGVDEKSGPYQNATGSDGIGDAPYIIDANNRDLYPFMNPWPPGTDVVPPSTTIGLSGIMGENDWFTSDVIVTLSATDDNEVDKTEYSFDGASWATYATPFTITTEGNITVYYRATDKAGNREPEKVKTMKIDKTAPSGSITIAEGANYTDTISVSLTLSSADRISGIAQMRFSINEISWTPWETFSISRAWVLATGDGTKAVYSQVKDNAGLVSQSYSDTITLDTTPPAISITSPTTGHEEKSSNVTATWIGSDETSGIDHYESRLDNGSWINTGTNTTYIFTGLSDGSHTTEVKAIDKAGNKKQDTATFAVNTNPGRGFGYIEAAAIIAAIIIASGICVYLLKFRKKA